jgi:hypothetical protein
MTAGTASDGTGWVVPEDDAPQGCRVGREWSDPPATTVSSTQGPRHGVKPVVMPKQGLF